MLLEQAQVADNTRDFLKRWGLKARYVAGVCFIPERILSQFLNHKLALSTNQLNRLKDYVSDYERRNS